MINIYDNITWKIQEFRQSASELDIDRRKISRSYVIGRVDWECSFKVAGNSFFWFRVKKKRGCLLQGYSPMNLESGDRNRRLNPKVSKTFTIGRFRIYEFKTGYSA